MPDAHPPPRLPGTLALAVLLAGTAGFLDAYLFQHVTPVFVANHSGNLIRIGMDIGEGAWPEAAITVCAIAAFVVGVGAATAVNDRYRQRDEEPRPSRLLVGELALLSVVLVLMHVFDVRFSAAPRVADYLVICIAAFTMGVQTAVLGRVGTVIVSTTYGSGSMAKIGEHSTLGARSTSSVERRNHGRAIRILAAVMGTYVSGAALASVLGSSRLTLLIPIGIVAFCAAASSMRERAEDAAAPWSDEQPPMATDD